MPILDLMVHESYAHKYFEEVEKQSLVHGKGLHDELLPVWTTNFWVWLTRSLMDDLGASNALLDLRFKDDMKEGLAATCMVNKGDCTFRIRLSPSFFSYCGPEFAAKVLIHEILHGLHFQLSHATNDFINRRLNTSEFQDFYNLNEQFEELFVDNLAIALSKLPPFANAVPHIREFYERLSVLFPEMEIRLDG